MKTLYLGCAMGAAGDMLMAALYELLPDKIGFLEKMNRLLPNLSVIPEKSVKCGIQGTHMAVKYHGEEEDPHFFEHHHDHDHDHEHDHDHGHEHDHEHSGMEEIGHRIAHMDHEVKIRSLLSCKTRQILPYFEIPFGEALGIGNEYEAEFRAFRGCSEAAFGAGRAALVADGINVLRIGLQIREINSVYLSGDRLKLRVFELVLPVHGDPELLVLDNGLHFDCAAGAG